MISGKRGFQRQEKTGLEWINKAAAKDYPLALFELSDLHRNGLESLVRKSQEKANKLLLKSADLGYAKANSEMATFSLQGTDGFEKDFDEAHFRASVAFALDASNFRAAWVLGSLHHCSGQYFCGNCYKEAEAGEKFKQCSKCRALWYCSKECQVEAWRAGHKQDCKRATILKFED